MLRTLAILLVIGNAHVEREWRAQGGRRTARIPDSPGFLWVKVKQ